MNLREAINDILNRLNEWKSDLLSKSAAPRSKKHRRARFSLRNRLFWVGGALVFSSVGLIGRAAYVQLVNSDFYQKEGDARFTREIAIPTLRGMMTDRNGEPVAVSTPVGSVWCDPKELLKNSDRLPELAQALGESLENLTRRVSQKANKEFMYLKRRINPDETAAIMAHNVPGVYSQREYKRFYPQGDVMAHVLGFTNVDDRGQEGLELAFDEWLSGKPGLKKVIRDRAGRIVEDVDLIEPAEPGKNLTLSIDRRIQYIAARELHRAIEANKAVSGSVVVLDVKTGEVLAMANLPTFNPNADNLGQPAAHRNRAVTDLVEPGSTMKPLTVSAALAAGVVTPETLIDTNPGYMQLQGGFTIRDVSRNNGVLSVTGVITRSSNIGAVKIAEKVPNSVFYNTIRAFGYGSAPNSGFPGEASGLVPSPERWSGTTKTTMSYGYGLAVSPLQLARAYAALGNGGKLVTPTFIKSKHSEKTAQVVPEKVARQVVEMMETVVTDGGAKGGAILGYRVAGKTGTARIASGGGYADGRYVSLFAGLAPATNPRLVTIAVIRDPQGGKYYGGQVSAPVFHNVMEEALRLMDVPPDDIDSWLAMQSQEKAKRAPKSKVQTKPKPTPNPALVQASIQPTLPRSLE